ncbi:MAG TPA: ATPase [Eubacteriaceae bacterium]|nr:ATPase [Eubacteriaceae bacterium]
MYTITIIVFATISAGVYFLKKNTKDGTLIKKVLRFNLSVFVPMVLGAVLIVIPQSVSAATEAATSSPGLGYIGSAVSTGLACLGSGVAVGNVGSAALGAVSEDEKMLGKSLIYVGLAEGIAIYGLVISIMILGSL